MEKDPHSLEIIIRKTIFIFVAKTLVIELAFGVFYSLLLWHFGAEAPIGSAGGAFFFILLETAKLFILLFLFLSWYSEYYEITNDEIIVYSGILKRRKKALSMKYAEAVTLDKGIFGRIGNYGTITVSYLANTRFELHLPHVPHPERHAKLLEHAISRHKEESQELVSSLN